MHYVIFAGMILAVYLFAMPAKAATVWTIQEGIYQKQKSAAHTSRGFGRVMTKHIDLPGM